MRATYPDLKMVARGWFASVKPELQLRDGVYDAVVCGQGEWPFRMIAEADWAGESISEIPSVAVWEDGAVRFNPRHAVVGWDKLLNIGWNSFIEMHSILHFKPSTLDLMAESGM